MNSEKVKEIKKALENCQKNNCVDCPYFIDEKMCRANDLLLDTITLINELESENERLREENGSLSCDLDFTNEKLTNAEIEVDDYKNRIAELEKENESLYDSYHKGYKVGYEYGKQDAISSDRAESDSEMSEITQTDYTLKQFAERLKEKFNSKMNWLLFDCVSKDIDETLKEFME